MSKFLFALAALATVTALPAGAATPPAGARIVRYADLDLSSAAGRARLEQRFGGAVRAVCGFAAPGDLNGVGEVRACRAATSANVVRPAAATVATNAGQAAAGTQ